MPGSTWCGAKNRQAGSRMGKSAGSLKFIQLNEGAPSYQPAGPRPGKKMCQWDLLVLIGSWLAEDGVLLGNACRS